jgi:hypothetical protein
VDKQDFMLRLSRAVNYVVRGNPIDNNEIWRMAVEGAAENGLGVSPSDTEAKNRILNAIIEISSVGTINPATVILINTLSEDAFKYQGRVELGRALSRSTDGRGRRI